LERQKQPRLVQPLLLLLPVLPARALLPPQVARALLVVLVLVSLLWQEGG